MVVLIDDENRENEGDLCIAAEKVTPEIINFMAKHGRGLICLSMTKRSCERLGLTPQAQDNTAHLGTNFMVSVDATKGITTGVSAADRALTIQVCIRDDSRPGDLVKPGHILTLGAEEGGVLVRAGQTEGSVDLSRLAGLDPSGVICEIMNDDGSMSRVPQLIEFCNEHNLKMGSVADIIEHRRRTEQHVRHAAKIKFPTRHGAFDLHVFVTDWDDRPHLALCFGGIGERDAEGKVAASEESVLARVHSECLTGDVFGSLRCDCGPQLDRALEMVASEGRGVVLYMRQEGRGIGLKNKLKAYALQDTAGVDTVEANEMLGFGADERDYGVGAQILQSLGIRELRLMTNNPRKIVGLEGFGLSIVERIPIEIPANPANHAYLKTKRDKLGHLLKGI